MTAILPIANDTLQTKIYVITIIVLINSVVAGITDLSGKANTAARMGGGGGSAKEKIYQLPVIYSIRNLTA